MALQLIEPPTLQVVDLATAKLNARIDGTALDPLVTTWIDVATGMAETACDRFFREQTWRAELDDWPCLDRALPLHRASACAIAYWDGTGAWVPLAAGAFRYYPLHNGTGTSPDPAIGWPALGACYGGPRVRVDLTAGDTEADTVPVGVKQYVLAHVALWAYLPEAAQSEPLKPAPWLDSLLGGLRVASV